MHKKSKLVGPYNSGSCENPLRSHLYHWIHQRHVCGHQLQKVSRCWRRLASSTKLFCSSPPTTLLSNTPLICIVPTWKIFSKGQSCKHCTNWFSMSAAGIERSKGMGGERCMHTKWCFESIHFSSWFFSVFSAFSCFLYTGSCTYSSTTSLQPPAVAMQIGGSPCDLIQMECLQM